MRALLVVALLAAITAGLWILLSDGGDSSRSDPPGAATRDRESARVPVELRPDQRPVVGDAEHGSQEVAYGVRLDLGDRSPGTRIRVVDSRGTAVVECFFALLRSDGRVREGRTDATGGIILPADGDQAFLVVAADGRAPHVEPLALEPGERDVRLPVGGVVAGTVHVDGEPAEQPVELALLSDIVPLQMAALPVPVQRIVEDLLSGQKQISFRSEAGGSFRVEGLPAAWSGSLYPEDDGLELDESRLTGARGELFLESPRSDLAVFLLRKPMLRGRALLADGETPLGEGRVMARVSYADRPNSRYGVTMGLEPDGRFAIALRNRDLTRVEVEIQPPSAPAHSHVPPAIPDGLDLGDIVLPGFRTLPFLARDAQGRAVPGASVSADDGESWSAPADENGEGSVSVSYGAFRLEGRAPGYLSRGSEVPAGYSGPVEIRFTATNELRIRLRDREGAIPDGVRVSLDCRDGILFQPQGTRGLEVRKEAGDYTEATWSENLTGLVLIPNEHGEIGITGVRSDVDILLRILPEAGRPLAEEVLRALPPTGRIVKEYVVEWIDRPFALRIVSETGEPIPGAEVVIGSNSALAEGTTNSFGELRFEHVHADETEVSVEKSGFVPWSDRAFRLPPADEVAEIRLDAGRTVAVVIEDRYGNPYDGDLLVRAEGYPTLFSGPVRDGRVRVTGLPPTEVKVRAMVHGRLYEERHDARIAELRVEVPPMGPVVLQGWLSSWDGHGAYQVRMAAVRGGTSQQLRVPQRPQPGGSVELGYVAVGRYRVSLEGTALQPDGNHSWETLAGPIDVLVEAAAPLVLPF